MLAECWEGVQSSLLMRTQLQAAAPSKETFWKRARPSQILALDHTSRLELW